MSESVQEIVIWKQAEIRTFHFGMKQGENSCGSEHWCCGGLAGRECLCPVSPVIPPLLQHQWDISTQLLAGTSCAVSRKQNSELSPSPTSTAVFLLVTGAIIISVTEAQKLRNLGFHSIPFPHPFSHEALRASL